MWHEDLQDSGSLGLAFCAIHTWNLLQVYSFGMVMLELLTGLAPATADATRREHKFVTGVNYVEWR